LVPAVGLAMLAGFVADEKRAAEPALPRWGVSRRVLIASSMTALAVGAVTLGLTSYIPTYVQGTLGTGALMAGFALAPLTIGWPIASSLSGRIYLRFGFRTTATIGAAIAVASMLVMILVLGEDSPVWTVPVLCFAIGCGMGLIAGPTLIAAQASVGWSQRGVVTGNNMFARSIGSALGVAAFGAVANAVLGDATAHHDAAQLADATHMVLLSIGIVTAAMFLAVVAMPGGRDTSQVAD
jgi:MFS family permease